jgi:DNA polymerase-4
MPGRAVIHIDLDSFFASVEIKKKPEIKGLPVVVGADGDPTKRGVVSAASYEARKFGIKAAMPLRQAKKLCPGAVFLPVDFAAYEEVSENFMAILRDYSPLVESFGLDEAFIEVLADPGADPYKHALALSSEMKARVKRELGLTASVGVGPNKLLAKMCSEVTKPDGYFVLEEKEVEKFLRDLPVRKLWGVGAKTENRLKELGINTVGELARTPVTHIVRNFGPTIGRSLHEHARGVDDSPVVPFYEPESMGREVTFEEDAADFHILRETLYALTEDVVARLKAAGDKAGAVTIKVRFNNFHTLTRSGTMEEPTHSLNDIWAVALRLLEGVDLVRPVRLVGVKLSGLV